MTGHDDTQRAKSPRALTAGSRCESKAESHPAEVTHRISPPAFIWASVHLRQGYLELRSKELDRLRALHRINIECGTDDVFDRTAELWNHFR
jgi:hypothetical protein